LPNCDRYQRPGLGCPALFRTIGRAAALLKGIESPVALFGTTRLFGVALIGTVGVRVSLANSVGA
jgi:hypothetical protein